MRIHRTNISRFRNLTDFQLELSAGVNLFHGENGHGKTNLLEAVALIINGRTSRTSKIQEVIPHDSDYAKWSVEIEAEATHHTAECIIETGRQKRLVVDGQPRKKLPGSDEGSYALTFFPEDFNILTGEPFLRRKFVDEVILLTEPIYARTLKRYRDAYASRNAMLKDGNRDSASFEPYEMILADLGIQISRRRSKALDELQIILTELSNDIFGNEISVNLEYKPSLVEFLSDDDSNASSKLQAKYKLTREREFLLKRTILGAHLDDFSANFRTEDIRRFSSRGETRISVVAMIIAKYHMLRKRWNVKPLILLDDIFSELDQSRRRMVLKALPDNCQLMITAVDKDLSRKWLEDMNDLATFSVLGGKIERD
jgi:DNA replication and repair protein RecF